MASYFLKRIQNIPTSPDKAWAFFSSPHNLRIITPPDLHFTILSQHHNDHIYAGQLIEYKIRPIAGIPLYWMTEITHVQENRYFVDEQRFGPYRLWHHQHHFSEIEGGVEMTDIVHYMPPLGLIGKLGHVLFLRKQLEQIFKYRFQQVEMIFGAWPVRPS
jgi:ligand-binding SRPBCC domain-containing protein